VSAYHQPQPSSSVPVPGYHCLADRVQRLDDALRDTEKSGERPPPRALQLDGINGYGPRACDITSRTVIVRPVPAFPALPWPATIRLAKPPLDFRRHLCASTSALDPMGM
jgi:hypothetical protein